MTGRRGSAPLIVVGRLRIDCGHATRDSRWLRFPAADYWCICGYTAEASGDQVPGFVAHIRARHRDTCPHPTT